jgi:uncharacterized protein
LSCLAALSACTGNQAYLPPLEGRVTDLAAIFSQTDRESLTKLLADYETETHHQIVVLTVPTLNGESIETFSLRTMNAWKIGLKGWNDGIAITLAMRERRVRVELGKGMERYITNAMAQDVIDRDMVPAFRHRDFAGGVRAGLLTLMEEARKYRVVLPASPQKSSRSTSLLAPGIA